MAGWDETDAQRRQDVCAQRAEGVLPLPGLRVGAADEPADAAAVPGSPTLEEGDGTGPRNSERVAAARADRAVVCHQKTAQSMPARMGELLCLRLTCGVISAGGHPRGVPCWEPPEKKAQVASHIEAVRIRRAASRVWHLGAAEPCSAESLRVKPVREPDAGNPHVRFDERRRGNGLAMGLGEQVSESDPCATGSDPSNRYRASRRLYKESYGFVVSVRIFPPVQLVGGNFPNPAGGPG